MTLSLVLLQTSQVNSMVSVKRLVLDVLKPHQPNALEFAQAIASLAESYHVEIRVMEVDEQTETLLVSIEGEQLDFERISTTISENGASLHSIDEVSVTG